MMFTKQRNACSGFALSLGTLALAACSSIPRADYPADANPTQEISNLETEIEQGTGQQLDVIAPKELQRSQKHLREAKAELASNDTGEFWNELATSRGYLQKALALSAKRSPNAAATLRAREEAIAAGARRHQRPAKELKELDESFRANARSLDLGRNDEAFNRLRMNYEVLELTSIQEAQVGEARDMIQSAKSRGARGYAPQTLIDAEAALKKADRAIAENPHAEKAFTPAVLKANQLARLLVAVNTTAREASDQTNEQVAQRIVKRNEAIRGLQSELKGADAEASMTAHALAERNAALRGAVVSNATLRSENEWNEALEQARVEFSEDEAEVYRQGDKLLIRLKTMQFPTGSAAVPERSKELLDKVGTVIEELNAQNVEVQGHTDATGSLAVNKKLSQARAEAVANYLDDDADETEVQAVGFGYEKPITSNKTPQGRAFNRRVDVIIVPSHASTPTSGQ